MADSHHSEHEHHPELMKTFYAVGGALLVLTAISFAVGNSPVMTAQPLAGWAMMMAISCAKALLVIMVFMHLKWEANWKYVLTIPASIMSLFLLLMLVPDVGARYGTYSSERLLHAADAAEAHHDSKGDHDGGHEPGSAGHDNDKKKHGGAGHDKDGKDHKK